MRRLLALGLAAVAVTAVAPAQAEAACVGERVGVCVTVIECSRICGVHIVVDPYCVQGDPAIGACTLIDDLIIDTRQ